MLTIEIIEGISYKEVAVYDIGDTYIKKKKVIKEFQY